MSPIEIIAISTSLKRIKIGSRDI